VGLNIGPLKLLSHLEVAFVSRRRIMRRWQWRRRMRAAARTTATLQWFVVVAVARHGVGNRAVAAVAEPHGVDERLVRDAAVPVAEVGLLVAPPG